MAVDITELERLRDELLRARASGTRELQYGEERVRYGTDAELAAAIADLDRRIRSASTPRPATVTFASSKGL